MQVKVTGIKTERLSGGPKEGVICFIRLEDGDGGVGGMNRGNDMKARF